MSEQPAVASTLRLCSFGLLAIVQPDARPAISFKHDLTCRNHKACGRSLDMVPPITGQSAGLAGVHDYPEDQRVKNPNLRSSTQVSAAPHLCPATPSRYRLVPVVD